MEHVWLLSSKDQKYVHVLCLGNPLQAMDYADVHPMELVEKLLCTSMFDTDEEKDEIIRRNRYRNIERGQRSVGMFIECYDGFIVRSDQYGYGLHSIATSITY